MNAFDSYEAAKEASDEDIILGLIGGMKDGMIGGFEYKGLAVHQLNGSVGVSPKGPPQEIKGGRLLLEGSNIHDVKEWLDEKAKLYGDGS